METKSVRRSVDLSGYSDLVVIYLGIRVNRLRGIATVLGLGRGIADSVSERPDGLLAHENVLFALNHIGMRQYWRDLESLERFTRGETHRRWWSDFLRDTGGTGFWHETYRMRGGMEAIYIDMPGAIGFASFAPSRAPQGPFMTARQRLAA